MVKIRPYPPEFRATVVQLARSGKTESFNASLSCELFHRHRFKTPGNAAHAVFDFIEGWYTPHRQHASIGNTHPLNLNGGVKPHGV